MIQKRVTRYYAECGRGYMNKSACIHHEKVCQCWKNPKHKTCLTCSKYSKRSETDECEGYCRYYTVNDCPHVESDESKLIPCDEHVQELFKNCPFWTLKQKK